MASCKGFRERLSKGETVICAAGCVSELARRGLIEMDDLTPEAALSDPVMVTQLHEDFVHCGTDIVVSCSQHGLRPPTDSNDDGVVSNESYGYALDESCERDFLKIARDVADRTNTLMAACISLRPTGHFHHTDGNSLQLAEDILNVRVKMAVEERADVLFCDSFSHLEEAKLALKCCQGHGKGLPVVLTLSAGPQQKTIDGVPLAGALRALEDMGADAVGLGCGSGPSIGMHLLREARKTCRGPLVAFPNAYRSYEGDRLPNQSSNSYHDVHAVPCTRSDIEEFSKDCQDLGVQFVGLCCGGNPSYIREIAQVYGRQTPASRFAPDVSKCCKNISNPTPTQAKRRLFQLTQEYRKAFMEH